jgi:hypothetical protein
MNDEAARHQGAPDGSGRDNPKTDLAAAIRDVVGALTALVTLIIVPGSIALWFRLQRAQLPADLGVVSSLPTQFLVAIGLTYVAAPLLVAVGLAVAALVLPGHADKPNPVLLCRWSELWKELWRWSGVAVVLFAAAALSGIPFAVFGGSPPWWSFFLSTASVLLWFGLSRLIARKYQDNITGRAPVALLALIATAVFVTSAVAFAVYRADFPRATVCTADGQHFDGVLIGETGNRVYVGEPQTRVSLFAPHSPDASKITDGLRAFGYEVDSVEPVDNVSQSADLLIADITSGITGLAKVDKLGVPVLGFVPRDQLAAKQDEATQPGVDKLAVLLRVETPSKLQPLVQHVITASPSASAGEGTQLERRIASISTSQVTRIIIGASGVCPTPS